MLFQHHDFQRAVIVGGFSPAVSGQHFLSSPGQSLDSRGTDQVTPGEVNSLEHPMQRVTIEKAEAARMHDGRYSEGATQTG